MQENKPKPKGNKMKSFLKFTASIAIFLFALFLKFGLNYWFQIEGNTLIIAHRIGDILFILSITIAILVSLNIFKKLLLLKFDINQPNNLKSRIVYTQYNILQKIIAFVVIIVSISLILMLFESVRKIGISLFASAGIAGIIIGLAAQKVIATILAGLQIAITQPIRLDDVVIVENEWGWIEEINLTFIVVRIWDKRRLVLPSTYFIEKPFQNWTRTTAELMGTVFIYTDYKIPIEILRKELTRLLQENSLWDKKTNFLHVTDTKQTTIELRALISARNSSDLWDLRAHIREKLIEFIQNNYPESLPRTRIDIEKNKEIPEEKSSA
jgi:small-conductance mechanosensitive channel